MTLSRKVLSSCRPKFTVGEANYHAQPQINDFAVNDDIAVSFYNMNKFGKKQHSRNLVCCCLVAIVIVSCSTMGNDVGKLDIHISDYVIFYVIL